MGVSSGYLLSKDPRFEVILIDRHSDVGQETSFCNGAFFCPSLCYPWINNKIFTQVFSSIFTKDYPIAISSSVLKEKYLFTWIFNVLFNVTADKAMQNMEKIYNIGQLSCKELTELSKEVDLRTLMNSTKGTIQLYREESKIQGGQQIRDKMGLFGCKLEVLDQAQIYNKEPGIANGQTKYTAGVYYPQDSNLDSFKTTKAISQLAESKGVKILPNTEFVKFVFEENHKNVVKGVLTNAGVIMCDKVVVASGNDTKSVLDTVGVRLPLMPIKGYTITVGIPENQAPLIHNVCDDESKIYVTTLGNYYRISGCAELSGRDYKIYEARTQLLLNGAMKKLGNLDQKSASYWTGFRPMSPDDVPIIGKVKGFENLYLNTGQGSKGLTLSLGSARLLSEIMGEKETSVNQKEYSLDRFYLI